MLTLRLAIADITGTPAWARLLDVAAGHPGRGVNDILLIARQRPDATELGTFDQWRSRGAQVRRGERGIALLLPLDDTGGAYDVVRVFDVTQTDATPAPQRPVPDLVRVVSALAALADRAGLTVRLGQGLAAVARADGDRLDLAANRPLSATAGHLVHHLAFRTLPEGPVRDVQAAGVAHIVARRFGLRPPDTPLPEPRHWAALLEPASPGRAVVDTAAVVIARADALTARLRRMLEQAPTPPPVPMPRRPSGRTTTEPRPAAAARAAPEAGPAHRPTRAVDGATRGRANRSALPAADGAARGATDRAALYAADRAALYAANAAAAAFYATRLPGSRAAAAYLRSRGIAAAADPGRGWQLGVAPAGGDALLRHLRALGFADQVMLDAGLVAIGRRDGGLYDLFRERLVFPIHAPDGQIAGFTGRDLSGRSPAKFFNTAETAIFRKSSLLFGLAGRTGGQGPPERFVVVEGPPDAIAAHLIYSGRGTGRTVAVASCGTAFTRAHFDLLSRVAGPQTRLVMSFDDDRAGARALDRAYPLAVTWPHGPALGTRPVGFKDIADLLAARGKEEALAKLSAAERPLPLLGVRRALDTAFPERFNAEWPEDRIRAYRTIAPFLLDAVGQDQVDLVVRAAAERLGLDPHEITDGVVAHFASEHEDGPGRG
ncbi:toprim domain-containing protein [Catellatospora sp. NPDC049609]|uniref:toprim domain-containing protein n=1 Tax=Catellatospora sp. NPDC049609 TaxID=3155505 RepID=UPI0034120C93